MPTPSGHALSVAELPAQGFPLCPGPLCEPVLILRPCFVRGFLLGYAARQQDQGSAMAWQSIFDAGTCTVTVSNAGVTQWSGVLAKGSSSPLFHGVGGANESMQVTVDGSGQVSLAWQPSAIQFTDNYTVSVNPTSPAVLGAGCRSRNVSCYVHSAGQIGLAADVKVPATALGLSYAGTLPGFQLMSPNPVDLSAQPSPVALAIAMGTTGPLTLSGTLVDGAVGTPYASGLSVTGGWPGYSWSISAGSLPPGLSLNPTTGLITGTPT